MITPSNLHELHISNQWQYYTIPHKVCFIISFFVSRCGLYDCYLGMTSGTSERQNQRDILTCNSMLHVSDYYIHIHGFMYLTPSSYRLMSVPDVSSDQVVMFFCSVLCRCVHCLLCLYCIYCLQNLLCLHSMNASSFITA